MNLLRRILAAFTRHADRDECGCYVCPAHDATDWATHVPTWLRAMLAAGWRVEAVTADAMAPDRRQVVTITLAPPKEGGE